MSPRFLILVAALAACAAGCRGAEPAGQAERPDPTSIEAMARASELVLVGRVVRCDARWVGRKIITVCQVEPVRRLKGSAEGLVEVAYLGGTVGVIHQEATHTPALREGEVAVLFLVRPAEADDVPGLRILSEAGRIPLLAPGEAQSRLANNKRLVRYLDEVAGRVEEAGR